MDYTNIFVSAISKGGKFPLSGILEFLRQMSKPASTTLFDFNCWISKAVFDELYANSDYTHKENSILGWHCNAEHSNITLTCSFQSLGNCPFYKVTTLKNGHLKYVFKDCSENPGLSKKNVFFLTHEEAIVFKM